MNLKEFIIKKPLILVCFLLIFLGIVFFLLGIFIRTIPLKDFLVDIAIFVFFVIILFSALVTYFCYTGIKRPFDSLIVPLFLSVFLICMTLILMLFFMMFKSVYISSIEPDLNHIVFPLAIFAIGISLYYFFVAQFSTDKKLDLISEGLMEIKDCSILNTNSIKK